MDCRECGRQTDANDELCGECREKERGFTERLTDVEPGSGKAILLTLLLLLLMGGAAIAYWFFGPQAVGG